MHTVREGIEDLNKAFYEFKSSHEECLEKLTTKGKDHTKDQEFTHEQGNYTLKSLEDRLARLETVTARPEVSASNPEASPQEREQKTAFLSYIRKGEEAPLLEMEQKNLSSDNDGGYLVPQVLDTHLLTKLETFSSLRRLANVMTISSEAVDLLLNKKAPDVGWASEKGERAETAAPELIKHRIPVHEMYAKPRATQKLLDDAKINLEEWLALKIGHQMAVLENQAFLYGNGEGKPKGILSYDLSDSLAGEWGKPGSLKTGVDGGFVAKQGYDVLIEAANALHSKYHNDAVWLMSPSALAAIRKLKDQNGQYIWQQGLEGDARLRLLGYPVIVNEAMPALVNGTASRSIMFGNFKDAYQIVDRYGTRTLRDPYSSKPYVEFYTTRRVGGDMVDFNALKIINFAK